MRIIDQIKINGFQKAIETYNLRVKDLGHKVLLKYDQLKSPKYKKEVQEARGLVLEKETWAVMSMPLYRFFDHDDILSNPLDWEKTIVMEKRDGSLIQVYWDWVLDEWSINTMFSDCSEYLYLNGEKSERTLKTLFVESLNELGANLEDFVKGYTYIFELTSPYNKVVVDYSKIETRLLAVRDISTLEEFDRERIEEEAKQLNLIPVENHNDNFTIVSLNGCLETFKGMSHHFEGYVAWDGVNRIKIKNPSYKVVANAQLRSKDDVDMTNKHNFLDIVKYGDITTFYMDFPNAKDFIISLNLKYMHIQSGLQNVEKELEKPKNISKPEKKKFAAQVFAKLAKYKLNKTFGSVFFLQLDKEIKTDDYLLKFDNKKLYKAL